MWNDGIGFVARSLLVGSVFLAACAPAGQQPAAQQPPAQQQPAAPAGGGSIIFFSNQFKPVAEQAKMQDVILKDSSVKVEYIPEDPGPFNDRLNAEQKAGKVTVSLIGALHGDMDPFNKSGYLEDLTPLVQ